MRRCRPLALLVPMALAVLALAPPAPTAATAAPARPAAAARTCGGEPLRHSELVAVTGTGRRAWTSPLPAHCDSADDSDTAPIVDGGSVYAAQGGIVVAVDERTGRRRWTRPIADRVSNLIRTSDGLLVATLPDSGRSQVELLDAATGRVRWAFSPAGGPVLEVLATGEGGVVLTQAHGPLRVLDLRTGRVRWQAAVHPWPSVATAQGVLAVSDDRTGVLRAYDARTGRLLWKRKPGSGNPRPVFEPGLVIAQSGGLTAYSLRAGRRRWILPGDGIPSDDYQLAAVGRGFFVALRSVDTQETVTVIDVATGRIRWQRGARIDVGTPVALVDGVLSLVVDGRVPIGQEPQYSLVGFRIGDGTTAWRLPLPAGHLASPITYDGPAVANPVLPLAFFASIHRTHLIGIDLVDHRVLWATDVRTPPLLEPTVAGRGAVAKLLDPSYGAAA